MFILEKTNSKYIKCSLIFRHSKCTFKMMRIHFTHVDLLAAQPFVVTLF